MERDDKTQLNVPRSPIVALDLGQKRIGIAVSDELSISIKRLDVLRRTNWKQLLKDIDAIIRRFDAKTLVIGLPLQANGSLGDAATAIQSLAQKFARSLDIPVYLQDERLTSAEAEAILREANHPKKRIAELVDSEAAALILRDFIVSGEPRMLVQSSEQTV